MRKLLSMAIAVGVFASTSLTPAFALDVNALPRFDSDNGLNSNVKVTTPENGVVDMNVQIQGGKGSVGTAYWDSFNLGANKHLNFEFTDHNQTSLNRVNQAGGMSEIYGTITNSGCNGCGYADTGKVILLNPNGVLFGNGANVNLNSFTVSTMDGQYEALKDGENLKGGNLTLSKGENQSNKGIKVLDGAYIHGDKGVTFASDNVSVYNGSKITTNVAANVGDTAYGKIKIVTADGVNFAYYNNGAVKNISDEVSSETPMMISVNGYLESGNIDIRNYSKAIDSSININGAALKAVKAVKGNDGNIWLTANNKVILENSVLETTEAQGAESSSTKGNVEITAGDKVSVQKSKINAAGNILINAKGTHAVVDSSVLSANNITVEANQVAELQNNTKATAKNTVKIEGNTSARILDSTVKGKSVYAFSREGEHGNVSIQKSVIDAADTIGIDTNGNVNLNDSKFANNITEDSSKRANRIVVKANDDITSTSLSGSTFRGSNISIQSTAENIKFNDLAAGSGKQFDNVTPIQLKAAKNIEVDKAEGDLTVNSDWSFEAGEKVSLKTQNGDIYFSQENAKLMNSGFKQAAEIEINSSNDVLTLKNSKADFNNLKTTINAQRDINMTADNVSNTDNALTAHAGRNMTFTANGDLAVSELVSKGDMTLDADKILSGNPKTNYGFEVEGDSTDRAYIEVGGKFTTNTQNGENDFNVSNSREYTNDGKYLKRHYIEFGQDGEEKILLVNDRPVENTDEPPTIPEINNGGELDPIEPEDAGQNVTPTPGPTNPQEDPFPDGPSTPINPDGDGECDNPQGAAPDVDIEEELPDINVNTTPKPDEPEQEVDPDGPGTPLDPPVIPPNPPSTDVDPDPEEENQGHDGEIEDSGSTDPEENELPPFEL